MSSLQKKAYILQIYKVSKNNKINTYTICTCICLICGNANLRNEIAPENPCTPFFEPLISCLCFSPQEGPLP